MIRSGFGPPNDTQYQKVELELPSVKLAAAEPVRLQECQASKVFERAITSVQALEQRQQQHIAEYVKSEVFLVEKRITDQLSDDPSRPWITYHCRQPDKTSFKRKSSEVYRSSFCARLNELGYVAIQNEKFNACVEIWNQNLGKYSDRKEFGCTIL